MSANCQVDKHVYIPTNSNGDTSLWYKLEYERDNKIGLQHLIKNTEKFYFRFRTFGQIVDIWSGENDTYYGQLTNYVDTYESSKENGRKRKTKTYSTKIQLDSSIARKVFILTKTINSIPTDDSVKEWWHGFDGIIYTLETSYPTYYSFKTYWSPHAQDSTLVEAKLIQSFVDNINSTINLEYEWHIFFDTLKPGQYDCGASNILVKLSEKEIKRIEKNKPHNRYMNSVSDSLDHYLSDTLTKIVQAKELVFLEYIDYYLYFSPKNKLKKVRVRKDNFSFDEKMSFYKCRRRIKKAFKKIPIEFVDSKIGYWKMLNYFDNKVKIY